MSGNIVFDLENLRGASVGDASRVFFDWASGHSARKLGMWGVPLSSITLRDLSVHNEGLPSNGLYIFYRTDGVLPVVMYVGKCTSRSFLERVPSHLESREECWFNTLTTRARGWKDAEDMSYESASDFCLENLSVAIIPIECGDRDREKTSRVGLLERRLRDPMALNPVWNSCSTKVAGRRVEKGDLLVDDQLYPSSREPAKPVL